MEKSLLENLMRSKSDLSSQIDLQTNHNGIFISSLHLLDGL